MLAVQGIRFRLTGSLSSAYDIYYRMHVSNYGWLGWAKNGATAGTTGLAEHAEAIQVAIVPAGAAAPGDTSRPSIDAPQLTYSAYAAGRGWLSTVSGGMAGTSGQGRAIEAFKVNVSSSGISGGVSYRAHVSNVGWMNAVSSNGVAGMPGKGQQVEAVQMSLTGNLATFFDIWYRVYARDYGWLGWTSSGATAGTTSCGLRVEGVQIAVRGKGVGAPGSSTTGAAFASKQSLPYIGYQNPWPYFQVSNKSVGILHLNQGFFGYRTESKIPYNATRNQCVNAMVTTAMSYVGNTTYVWDYACAPGVGVDCAGLVMQALYATGMDLSPMNPWDHYYAPEYDHYANDIRNNSRFAHVSFESRQPSDLIMTNGHVSIYIGGDRIVEAYSPRVGVRVASVYSSAPILAVVRSFQ